MEIFVGWALGTKFRVSVSMPSSTFASIFSLSTWSGTTMEREKLRFSFLPVTSSTSFSRVMSIWPGLKPATGISTTKPVSLRLISRPPVKLDESARNGSKFHKSANGRASPLPLPERIVADLLYYLGEDDALSFVRPRDETIGAIESPSERSARMALLADLLDARGGIVIAPLGAIRQYVMPRKLFAELRLKLRVNDDAGWEETLARLHLLGYNRSDVVSAAGEYAVRGGILDVFPPCSDSAVRVEFFGDTVESIRTFDLVSQRSTGTLEHIRIDPWTEIPRDARYRERVLERFEGPTNVRRALHA